MKYWQGAVIAILIGIIGTAVIQMISAPPRGTPVELIPPPTPAPLQVYIDGEIESPGVYQMPAGSRVEQLVEKAGGLSASADTSSLNLAAVLEDAEKIHIPFILPTQISQPPADTVTVVETIPGDGQININTASREELETLPGIGPVIAGRIIEYRQFYGPFQFIEDLQRVEGIGPAIFEKVIDLIDVEN